ncbi:unnamed protein product [Caenorhabditis bovis]|uniref:K Homology domain-containing protein n=1 Tax=Caenorhabditis bovis TaxID=2654633 RepID=A0A8S1F7Q9_9PELO|nr:unnamed protein product [Caenorhabditis bovis]
MSYGVRGGRGTAGGPIRGQSGNRGGRGGSGGPRGGGMTGGPSGYPPQFQGAYPGPQGYGPGYGYQDYDASYGGFGGYGMPPGYGGFQPEIVSPLDQEIQCVLREIHTELATLDSTDKTEQFRNARRLLDHEKERLETNMDPEWLEVDIAKPVRVVKKVLIPNYRHPHFNFVGKILGPKGATLQSMAKTHKCHIYVLGRGSTKDMAKEAELLRSGDAQHAHFGGPLHVKIETVAPAHIAYSRVAAVIEDLARILQPVHEDTTPSHMKNGEENSGEGKKEGGEEAGNSGEGNGSGGRGRGRGGYGRGGMNRGGRGRGGAPYG